MSFEEKLELLENAIDNRIKDPFLLAKLKRMRFSLDDSVEDFQKILFIGLFNRYKQEFKNY